MEIIIPTVEDIEILDVLEKKLRMQVCNLESGGGGGSGPPCPAKGLGT